MESILQITADGSHTIYVPDMNVTYHSVHGAVQESRHVFIKEGLDFVLDNSNYSGTINIFEMGFGTGLNALLASDKAIRLQQKIYYEAAEIMPLDKAVFSKLNYELPYLNEVHECDWDSNAAIHEWFTLHKVKENLLNLSTNKTFHLVFYDAFAPTAQPELWTEEVFRKLFSLLNTHGVLVTYCSKSYVRRNMMAAGFIVEKVPGPPGKREMLRAVKRV